MYRGVNPFIFGSLSNRVSLNIRDSHHWIPLPLEILWWNKVMGAHPRCEWESTPQDVHSQLSIEGIGMSQCWYCINVHAPWYCINVHAPWYCIMLHGNVSMSMLHAPRWAATLCLGDFIGLPQTRPQGGAVGSRFIVRFADSNIWCWCRPLSCRWSLPECVVTAGSTCTLNAQCTTAVQPHPAPE